MDNLPSSTPECQHSLREEVGFIVNDNNTAGHDAFPFASAGSTRLSAPRITPLPVIH